MGTALCRERGSAQPQDLESASNCQPPIVSSIDLQSCCPVNRETLGRDGEPMDVLAAMGMTVTAKGVETAEQLALLCDDQCHEVQGFLLSKPLENEALMGMMKDQVSLAQ